MPVRESTYKYHALDGNTVRLWCYQRLCYVENAFCRCHHLVGNIKGLCWYQRLQRIKDCSVPVREQPLSRWKVLHRYREVDDFQEVPQYLSQEIPPRRFNKSPRHQIWMYTNTE
jgi:hypothetical protein